MTDQLLGALIAIRLLIGLFEAGFYPTSVSYLSFFYTRFDLAVRIAIFYGQYAIAGAFSGALCKSLFSYLKASSSFKAWTLICMLLSLWYIPPSKWQATKLAVLVHH